MPPVSYWRSVRSRLRVRNTRPLHQQWLRFTDRSRHNIMANQFGIHAARWTGRRRGDLRREADRAMRADYADRANQRIGGYNGYYPIPNAFRDVRQFIRGVPRYSGRSLPVDLPAIVSRRNDTSHFGRLRSSTFSRGYDNRFGTELHGIRHGRYDDDDGFTELGN